MRSERWTIRVPIQLAKVLREIAKDDGYHDTTAMTLGAYVILVQNHRRKAWVPAIANAKPKQQDYLIEHMLKWPTNMVKMLEMIKKLD